MTLIALHRPIIAAEANWGRWIVRCPACPSALALKPGAAKFVCWDCDATAEVLWPSESMVHGVERLLMMRPNVATRNWTPDETLSDLLHENVLHGSVRPELDSEMLIVDDRIELDTLPAGRQAIGA